MADSLQISPAEWDVMGVVWDTGPITAADVIARLSDSHDWSHRTIRTLLARLVEKGALAYDVDGKAYIYRPAITRKQCVREESRSFMNKVFGGDVGALLVHFVQDANLDPQELERLRDLLASKDQRRRKTR
jgi:BlaI family transcriptional regulator, penicillinase repressor